MFQCFENYITQRATLTGEELDLIRSLAVAKKIARREFVLREGEISGKAIFVTQGILRLYRVDDKGAEHILKFAKEEAWINDRESYLMNKPSCSNIEAIEDSGILTWEKADFRFLLSEIPALRQVMKTIVEKGYLASQSRIYTALSSSAEEKYAHFIATHPQIFNRVPLHMVAAYLGVSRETLSRIRARSVPA